MSPRTLLSRSPIDYATLLANEAVALNTNLAVTSRWGWVALMSVIPDLAIESFQRMIQLIPLDPLINLARLRCFL